MNSRMHIWFLATSMGVVGTFVLSLGEDRAIAQSPHPEQQAVGNSVARYATGDFFAACCVRPKGLIANPFFGSLPLYIFVPDPVSIGRLDTMGIEELAVFCACPDESQTKPGRPATIQWAAAARTSKDIDLETVMRQWRHAIVLEEKEPPAKPLAIEIDGRKCFRVPAGRFFMPSRTYGALRFTDRTGKPTDEGISIGRIYPRRGYAEGATNASAVFTFDHLDESDLVDAQLPLEIYPDVYLVRALGKEYSVAQIELRNPDTGLRSEPIAFQPESYVNHRLNVPRTLTAVDASGKRKVDLLKDLVAGGRIEVILKSTEPGVYIGVGPRDLYLRHTAFEYVFVSGREIVIAQSPETLQAMLRAAKSPVALAHRIARSSDDVVMVANLTDPSRRIACQRLVSAMGNELGANLLGDGWTDMTATVTAHPSIAGQITASFADPQSASQAASDFKQFLRSANAHARTRIKDLLSRGDIFGALTSLGFEGVSMSFPTDGSMTLKSRESHLLSLIGDALDNVHVEAQDKILTVQFTQPEILAHLPEQAQVAIANIEEALARDLFERDRYDQSDEMYRRVTDRFPHVPQLWFRRAHQFAYNTSPRFTSSEDRYAWVRRGVTILLDGAEQNPDRTDLTWMAARFIGWKIGDSDDRAAYRQLFSQDKTLHQRLGKFIDLEKARSPDKAVDNWLVAKMLFQDCIDRQELREHSTIPPLPFFARLAAAQAKYAEALSESGHWNEARPAWKEAEQLHHELAKRTIVLWNLQSIRLDELKSRLAKSGPNDPTVKLLQTGRRLIQFDYWLARCELEPTEKMQLARRLSQEAAIDARQSKPKQAYALYRQSLESLGEVYKQHPRQMTCMAGDFKPVAEGYRKFAATAAGSDERPLAPILTLIEGSKPISRNPFFDVPKAGERETAPAE